MQHEKLPFQLGGYFRTEKKIVGEYNLTIIKRVQSKFKCPELYHAKPDMIFIFPVFFPLTSPKMWGKSQDCGNSLHDKFFKSNSIVLLLIY